LSELFLTVLNMSLTASVVIVAIMLARILLKRAPKVISYVLWVVAGFRLVFPFSFESVFSLIPFKTQLIPQTAALREYVSFSSAVGAAYHAIGDAAKGGFGTVTVYLGKSSDGYPIVTEAYHSQVWLMFGSYLWIIGIAILLIYSFVSIILLKRWLSGAVLLQDNIYKAENLKTPFVLGFIHPKIYIPSNLSEEEKSYIILHEQAHIKRLDHIVKLIAFLILCVHWFNPLVWVAFILMSTDMEMSCDEKVLKAMNEDVKKPYANTLLSLAAERHILNGSPLAFGEGNVKERIKNVLNYKKPRFWLVLIDIIVIIVISVGLLCNPQSDGNKYRIDETKVIQMTEQVFPGGEIKILDNSICNRIINEINNSKWSKFKEDWPDEEKIAYKIIITMQRDDRINDQEYTIWCYRDKYKKWLGQEHEYALVLTYNDLSDNIKIWSLPRNLYYNIRGILTEEHF
jgi:beta-lactamase regulating signal transducer with metallopeptidase domain